MWYRMALGWRERERELDIEEEGEEEDGVFGGESLNLMKLGRQIYHPKPLPPSTPCAVPFSSYSF